VGTGFWIKIMPDKKNPGLTPSQTVGPYFAYGLTPKRSGHDYDWSELITEDMVTPDAAGERIRIEGFVYDGDGLPVSDALIEVWQADAQGRYAHPRDPRMSNASFKGFGRCGTDATGKFVFDTIKPGPVPGPAGSVQAPHLVVTVFMRGLLTHLFTRIYFANEPDNARDPVLLLVPASRRDTLIASRETKRETKGDVAIWRFDIHMQGEKETVFFDV
jgi:protocatechuate 3,4-dioxygenase alpha subunit